MNPKNRRWLLAIALGVLLYGLFRTNAYELKRDSEGIVPIQDKDPVSLIIERLIACESGGNPNAYHAKDGDGTDSVGILQFKLKTFVGYAKQFNLFPHADAADLQNLWNDKDAQITVAKEMISKDRKNLLHWRNCSKKYNLI